MGYLKFTAGNKNYLIHRVVYGKFHGPIKDGLSIDHENGVMIDSHSSNLQAISQRDNFKKAKAGRCSKHPKSVKSFDFENNEQRIFQSMYAAGKYFDICISSVQKFAEGIYSNSCLQAKWT